MLQTQGERGVASIPKNWWYRMLLESYSMQMGSPRTEQEQVCEVAPSIEGQNVGLKLVLRVLHV